jgi:predicted dehydrogenase
VLKVAIVGCGKIADSHAAQIMRIKDCEIVAACDREPLMARQLCDRFPIKQHFCDVQQMLTEAKPDVVHISTPPQTHFDIAKLCLENGAHVYVEKPFTLNEQEARELIALAQEKNLKLTAGHDDQFSHVARRMRSLAKSGFLGDGPLHMESHYCYEIGRTGYAGALLGDPKHWVRRLPGKLLHNIISHGIARIAEFLEDDSPKVIAHGFVSPTLQSLGEKEIIDELRVIVSASGGSTAYFTFSSQIRPSLHQFKIYGSKNGLALDQDQETLIRISGSRHKSYVEKFLPPVNLAKQYLGNLKYNLGKFLARDFQMKSGMKELIEAFYRSITEGTPAPIPYREIILVARIEDAIFEQIYKAGDAPQNRSAETAATGATAR